VAFLAAPLYIYYFYSIFYQNAFFYEQVTSYASKFSWEWILKEL